MPAEHIRLASTDVDSPELRRVAKALAEGAVVVFPTETVYGVCANAGSAEGMARLRQAKTRDADKPFTVHIGKRERVEAFVPDMSALARRLVHKGWPGPLTLIFSIDNQSTKAVDVDMLLIGPNYSIKHMLGLRFQRGDNIKGALGDIADAGSGLWRLVLVMREAARNSVHSDLSFLNQIGTQTRAAAAAGARDFGQLLKDIGGGAATRGAASLTGGNALKGSLDIFNLEARPGG